MINEGYTTLNWVRTEGRLVFPKCQGGEGRDKFCYGSGGMEEIVMFYTEILTREVVLWCYFISEKIGKGPSTFRIKTSA